MKALNDALYSTMSGDGTLAALLASSTSVYPVKAPYQSTLPYVVFIPPPVSTDEYTYTGRAWEELVYTIKGVTQGFDPNSADAIADRIDALLTDTVISVSGFSLMYNRRAGRIAYNEDADSGDHYFHRGGLYRFMLDPN